MSASDAAKELYDSGKLDEAIEASLERVKAAPTDSKARAFLSELLCFAGDLERADKQLDILVMQEPDALLNIALLRQLIRGETARREVFREGRSPEFAAEPTAAQKLQLQALAALREANGAEAAKLLTQAEEARPEVKGTHNGEAFEDLRDLDDAVSGSIEIVTGNGTYYWVAWEQLESVEFRAPEMARDLLWRSAAVSVRDGMDGEVYIPVNYVDTHASGDDALRLGRATDWNETPEGPVRGVGQRTLLVGDADLPILGLGDIRIG